MYINGSEEFNRLIETPNNKAIQKRLVFEGTGGVIDKFKTLIMYSTSNNQELQIGTTNMSYLDVEAFTDIAIFDGQKLRLECGVELSDGSMEYAPMGVFTAVNTEKGLNSVKFTANDNMQKTEKLYTSSLTYPTTSDKIISEICEMCEIELATPIENLITVTEKLQGYTCREVLGFIAGIHGKFACFDRLGQLNLRWYSEIPIEKQNSLIWSFTKSQEPFVVDKIEIAKNTETKFTSGEGNNVIYHSNPLATQQITNDILDDLRGFSYSTSKIEMLDDIRLDIWDVIKVTYLDGNEYFIPCMSIKQNMGASSTYIESFSKSKTQNQYRYEGPTAQFINRMATELLITNRIVASKVDTDYVDAQVGKINTLIFGSASGNVISTQFSNSVIAQLGDAQIKSAMIQDVSASKISAGIIYTNDVTIQSENGQMMLKDNTIQISDGTRARVQIGKDASDDYSINVWDKDGKLMFSQGGITDAAIKDAIIRNDMVSENANIHAGKLDISSLFTEINDNTTRSIKATKIYIDEKGQSLEFAFKQMTTTVDNITQTQTSQGTQLEIINGQISSKIWQQDITSAIDNVDIGGRNLLLNTKEFSKTTTQNQTGIALDIGKFTDYYMITRTAGKKIAISFDWETTATSGTFRLTFNNTPWAAIFPDSTVTITSTNQKGRMEYVATLTEAAVDSTALYTALRLRIDNVDGTTTIKNVKCEYGNKTTDWTPAPEEMETQVTSLSTKYSTLEQDVNGFKTTVAETYTTLSEFKALSIGGSNLFRDTRTMISPKYFIILEDTLTLRQEDGYGIATLPANSDWNGISLFFQEKIEDLVGKQVTLSFDAKSDGLTLNKNQWLVQMAVFDSSFNRLKIKAVAYLNSTRYFNTQDYVDNEWVRCRVTFTLATVEDMTFEMDGEATKYAVQIYSGEENDAHPLEVRKIKCEYGNKNTDWTPSPDDTEESIASLITKNSTLEQTVDGFKTEVSTTYATKNALRQTNTIATQTAEQFTWIVNGTSQSDFTLTDRTIELVAENIKVTGDMIVDGAITADKIAIGNFSNLAIINPDEYNPYNYEIITDENGSKWFKFGSDNELGYYKINMNILPPNTTFKKGDKYIFRGKVRATTNTSIRVCLRVNYSDNTYNNMATVYYDEVTETAKDLEVSFEVLQIPNNNQTIKNYTLFLETRNTKLGTLFVRELSVQQMTGNVLIADGAITANKINVSDLFAQDIVASGSITSPILKSADYVYDSGDYTRDGMIVDLKNKLIKTTNFAVKSDGSIVVNDGIFKGKITATGGEISGNLEFGSSGSITHTNGDYSVTLRSVKSSPSLGVFFITDNSGDTTKYPFIVRGNGAVTATNITATGTINADEGRIGPITIQKNQGLYYNPTAASGFGLWATSEHDNIAFHAGANNNNIGGAPFRIYHDGSVVAGDLTAGNVNLTGGKIGNWSIQDGALAGIGSGTKMILYPNGVSYNVTSSTTDTFFLVVYNAGGTRPVGGLTNSGWKTIV